MFGRDQLAQVNSALSKAVVPLMEKWLGIYKSKNENYGASWLLTGEILYLCFGDLRLDTPQKHIIYGLVVRMFDKILRGANLELSREKDKVGEASQETFGDLGVYGFMAAMGTQLEGLLQEIGCVFKGQAVER